MVEVRRYAAFGNESTPGTAVPQQVYVDILSSSLDPPTGTEIIYPGALQRGDRTRRPGPYKPGGNIVFGANLEQIARSMYYALGKYVYTVGSTLHECYADPDTVPPYFTTYIGKDLLEHVFTGCSVGQLVLAAADGFVTLTPDIVAFKDEKDDIETRATVVAALGQDPMMYHEFGFDIPSGEMNLAAGVKDFTLTIQNNIIQHTGISSRFPVRNQWGARAVTVAANLRFDDTDELTRFWGNALIPGTTGATDFDMEITGVAADAGTLSILINSAHYAKLSIPVSARGEIFQAVEIKALIAAHTLNDASTPDSELLVSIVDDAGDVSAV